MGFERSFSFILGIPILLIIEVFRFIKAKRNSVKFLTVREIVLIIFYLYIMSLISVTLLPLYMFSDVEPTANIVPVFNTIRDIKITSENISDYMIKFWIINIVGNLLLLIPLSIISAILFDRFRSIKLNIILCFSVSVFIEFIQYSSMFIGNIRSADIDDVILNTLGGIIGFFIFNKLLNKFTKKFYLHAEKKLLMN